MSEYKYQVEEKSLTQDFLLQILWNPIANHLPTRLTPNTITVFGGMFMMASAIFIWLALQGNSWGFPLAALCVFVYMTADNIDGFHARRTGQSSQLGEFLDHWLDSINAVVINLCIAFCLSLHGWLLLALMSCVAIAFFATIWEHHHTGVFQSGRVGTNEALLLIISLYLFLFFVPDYQASWLAFQGPLQLSLATIMVYGSLATCVLTFGGCLYRVRKHLVEFLPLLLLIVVFFLLGLQQEISDYAAALGILASNVIFSGPLLVDHLANCKSSYRKWIFPLIAIAGIILLVVPDIFPLRYFLWAAGGAFILTIMWDLFRAIVFIGKKA